MLRHTSKLKRGFDVAIEILSSRHKNKLNTDNKVATDFSMSRQRFQHKEKKSYCNITELGRDTKMR